MATTVATLDALPDDTTVDVRLTMRLDFIDGDGVYLVVPGDSGRMTKFLRLTDADLAACGAEVAR